LHTAHFFASDKTPTSKLHAIHHLLEEFTLLIPPSPAARLCKLFVCNLQPSGHILAILFNNAAVHFTIFLLGCGDLHEPSSGNFGISLADLERTMRGIFRQSVCF